mgnify:FL=1
MPINMMTGKPYGMNYPNMRKELMEMKIFHDKELQQMYIDKWVAELMEADKNSVTSYTDPNNQSMIMMEKMEAPETFQTIVNMQENELLIHFRVSRIIQMLQMSGITEADAIEISIDEFIDKKVINWTSTDSIVDREDPIIIFPFTIGKTYKELVVDGNHRVTTAIQKKKKTVKAIIVDPNDAVLNHMLSSSFDELLYVFQNEVVWMGSHYNENIEDEKMLIMQSFFMCGNVNVAI